MHFAMNPDSSFYLIEFFSMSFLYPSETAVDNGVKYDASRAYLSDLNVTENVWIGLMRSQNSDRFMWS